MQGENRITDISVDLFKSLFQLKVLSLESNEIVVFNKNSLLGLASLTKVCLFNNPISINFPNSLKDVCKYNSNCKVFINKSC